MRQKLSCDRRPHLFDLPELQGFTRHLLHDDPVLIFRSAVDEAIWIRQMQASDAGALFEVAYFSGPRSFFFHYHETQDADEAQRQALELREIASAFTSINGEDTPLGTLELGLAVDPAYSIAVFDAVTPDGRVPVFAALKYTGNREEECAVIEFGKSFSILEAFSFLKDGLQAERGGRRSRPRLLQ